MIKSVVVLILISLFFFNLQASVKVEYKSKLDPEIIKTEKISGNEYFNVFELNKVFKAKIIEDLLDQRLKVNMYDEQIIFLLESSYLTFQGKIYNFEFPIINKNGKFLIPANFLWKILPIIFEDKIEKKSNKLIAQPPINNTIQTIVLDPGHGGKDPGAIGFSKKVFEKDLVLTITKKVKKLLEKNMDVEVLLTRKKDKFVSLQERTKFANEHNADIFISIHCNAHRKKKVNGIEVFYLSTAKTDEARAVEQLENQVVFDYEGGIEAVKKYDDLAFILADMAQAEHLQESYKIATNFQADLINATDAIDRGVKQANFYVLRGAFMPSVLLELGFVTNKAEEKKLTNSSYQNKLANSIYEVIKNFKLRYDQMQ